MWMHDKCKIRTKATNSASALEFFAIYLQMLFFLFLSMNNRKKQQHRQSSETRQVTLVYFFLYVCLLSFSGVWGDYSWKLNVRLSLLLFFIPFVLCYFCWLVMKNTFFFCSAGGWWQTKIYELNVNLLFVYVTFDFVHFSGLTARIRRKSTK